MFQKVSKTDEIDKKLKLEGKVKYLDQPEDLEKMNRMNEFMEGVRRDYKYKSAMSTISASKITLTTSYNPQPSYQKNELN